MAFLCKAGSNGLAESGFKENLFASMTESRGFAGLLHVHLEVDQIDQYLHVPLWLVVTSHDTKRKKRFGVLHHETRDKCMEGAFAGSNNVGVTGIQHE